MSIILNILDAAAISTDISFFKAATTIRYKKGEYYFLQIQADTYNITRYTYPICPSNISANIFHFFSTLSFNLEMGFNFISNIVPMYPIFFHLFINLVKLLQRKLVTESQKLSIACFF